MFISWYAQSSPVARQFFQYFSIINCAVVNIIGEKCFSFLGFLFKKILKNKNTSPKCLNVLKAFDNLFQTALYCGNTNVSCHH